MLKNKENCFAFSRNPYHRLISAYLYCYGKSRPPNHFLNFCLHILPTFKFDNTFSKDIIHFYPQYLFVCDNDSICKVNVQKIEDFNTSSDFMLTTYKLENYYTEKSLKIINSIYHNDFEMFQYSKLAFYFGILL